MTVYWYCVASGCGEYGTTDKGAEKHTNETRHGTITTVDRARWLRMTGQEE